LVGDALLGRFRNGTFAKIGPIAEVVDGFLFLGRFSETVIDLIQQVRTFSDGR
jgi:hypothetical protein